MQASSARSTSKHLLLRELIEKSPASRERGRALLCLGVLGMAEWIGQFKPWEIQGAHADKATKSLKRVVVAIG